MLNSNKCKDCKGSGKYIGLFKEEICQTCSGSGKTKSKITLELIAQTNGYFYPLVSPGSGKLGKTSSMLFNACFDYYNKMNVLVVTKTLKEGIMLFEKTIKALKSTDININNKNYITFFFYNGRTDFLRGKKYDVCHIDNNVTMIDEDIRTTIKFSLICSKGKIIRW